MSFACCLSLLRPFLATVALLTRIAFLTSNRQELWTTLARLRPLAKLGFDARGWTLDVLRVLREIGKQEISLQDVYALERELARLHPQNLHVRDKIRQQLQVLRDLGFLEFLGGGIYRVR